MSFLHVSQCYIAKEMLDALQIIHEGRTNVKWSGMNTLTHEYELFRMKNDEILLDMEKCFIHIVSHTRILGKVFQNEDLVIKVLRCLNHS